MPGIRRVRAGGHFRYVAPGGAAIRESEILSRIKALAIPPAWTEVWICPLEQGHLQATGRDVKGRKQYHYHARWRQVRDETKYNRLIEFGIVLPKVRRQVQKHMRLPGLPRLKVLATVARLLEVSLIRVGNEEYARENHSFGLTTMRDQHVDIKGSTLRFHFRGKSSKQHNVTIDDPRLARIVKRCQDLPGQELFQYLDDDGARQTVDSADVNEYLRSITGQDFTAKDFRTWSGTVLAARALQEFEQVDSQAKAKKNVIQAVEAVSQMLGNTPSICRKCYVHPAIVEAYLDGALVRTLRIRADEKIASGLSKLKPEEAAVLAFLQQRLRAEEGRRHGEANRRLAHKTLIRGLPRPLKRAGNIRALPAAWRS
jgi:DNA topoisomerase-1